MENISLGLVLMINIKVFKPRLTFWKRCKGWPVLNVCVQLGPSKCSKVE